MRQRPVMRSRGRGPEDDRSADAANPARAASARYRFLCTEVRVGHTMLAAAATTQIAAVRVRRVANAQAAHDEVARHLVRPGAAGLSAAEAAVLAAALAPLRAALDALGRSPMRDIDGPLR